MKILIENSTWNNMGDGWYQSVIFEMFKKIYPEADVFHEDGPTFRSFGKTRFQENIYELRNFQNADIHVFSGPILKQVLTNYKQRIIDIKNSGNNYILLSVSGDGIEGDFKNEVGEFLKKYPPIFFSSRDELTYKTFKEFLPDISYNGICTAFLVDKYLPVDTINDDFFVSSFYRELEPTYSCKEENLSVENIKVTKKASLPMIPFRFARHLDFLRKSQESLLGKKVVRVRQGFSTNFKHIKLARTNSFISFNPINYLSLYKSTNFTISDRVHACAVTLAFGKPAIFLYDTPRAGIFSRFGWDYKKSNGIMYPKLEKIEEEHQLLIEQIKKYVK